MYTKIRLKWKWHGRMILTLFALILLALVLAQGTVSSQSNTILWQADFEEESFYDIDYGLRDDEDPNNDGSAGGCICTDPNPQDIVAEVTDVVAQSGRYSARATIKNAYEGESYSDSRAVRFMRRTDKPWTDDSAKYFPDDAYYSVWMYFPETYNPTKEWNPRDGWWNVFQFKSKEIQRDDNGNPLRDEDGDIITVSRPIWTLNASHEGRDTMYFDLRSKYNYDSSGDRYWEASPIPIPVREWVHIEAYYVQDSDGGGRVTFWQNGEKIIEAENVTTKLDSPITWGFGNYTDHITGGDGNGKATIYFDNAIVSTAPMHNQQPQPTNTAPTRTPRPSTPTPEPPSGESAILLTFEDGINNDNWRTYNKSNSTINKSETAGYSGNSALQVSYDVPYDGFAAAYTYDLPIRDWRGYKAIQFAFYGTDSGDELRFLFYDNGREIFEAKFDDNASGWRLVTLPFDTFTRADWQPDGAPNDGMTLSDVQRLEFKIGKDNTSINATFRVDDVILNGGTEPPPPEPTPQPPEPTPPPQADILFDFGDRPTWKTYAKSNSTISATTADGQLTVDYDVPSDGHAAAYTNNLPIRDWRGYSAIRFAFDGRNTGDEITFEIYDNGREIFQGRFDDNVNGWQTITLPFSTFTRASWQPDGAPNNGLTLSDVQRITFKIDKDSRSINNVFSVDDIVLLAD